VSARLLDGRAIADELRTQARQRAASLATETGSPPRLAIVRFSADGPAAIYAASVSRAASRAGLEPVIVEPDAAADTTRVVELLHELGADPAVAGIVVAQPMPERLDPATVVAAIDPAKDVDGAAPVNAGHLARNEPTLLPATARAVMTLLRASGIPVAGRRAVVVGRSPVIGRPVALLLVAADATVTVCHRATADLAAETRRAEILVVAAGSPGLVTRDMVTPGAVVIDCGINQCDDGICGDVAADVREVAGAISPVPGGVGPVTAMMVVEQTLESAERLASRARAG
jgi:methylenetetrahydrofolate dehydrogenase (NADP+)/methenyltetrahydrofolate cyclohydrolase